MASDRSIRAVMAITTDTDALAPQVISPEALWLEIRDEAEALATSEPLLKPLIVSHVLGVASPAQLMASVIALRLNQRDIVPATLQLELARTMDSQPTFESGWRDDLVAVRARDPACPTYLHALLHLKGFQALQAHRAASAWWHCGRQASAHWLSHHVSLAMGVDIHPAAHLASSLMLDHGSGIVIGETAEVGRGSSILQGVTLGGTGKERGDRHPKVREDVLVGAGAKILGNIEVGPMSKVAAGSVVLHPVPPYCTVAGVPARVVRNLLDTDEAASPGSYMDQLL